MNRICVLALGMLALAGARTDDSLWISHYNGNDGWFAFRGPQRAMRLDPADFGLEHPVQVESLKSWFYWGMGSRDDTVITFRIYGADGQTLLFESESINVPTANWVYYGLPEPVVLDSGSFYIATTHRLVNPWAHPYVNVDDNPSPSHSYYGSPGNWQLDDVGEFCFFAFVRELPTGVREGRWSGFQPVPEARAFLTGSILHAAGQGWLCDLTGRKQLDLETGPNDVSELAPGIYALRPAESRNQTAAFQRIIIPH
ncbi:MAG: hypothetical protein JSU73_01365 [candidate division WOR-3 bacterium]|nr:MAG: hypothetical protein JSU73_01365 [candidate division WOR-3 bacterium]